jgi:hypothetical protein
VSIENLQESVLLRPLKAFKVEYFAEISDRRIVNMNQVGLNESFMRICSYLKRLQKWI